MWYKMLIVTELIMTFHSPRSNKLSLQILSFFSKLFPTFFIISHRILHQFCSFLLDLSSTSVGEGLFHKIKAIALQNRDCCNLPHPWHFVDFSIWSTIELRHVFQSTSTSLSFICFHILDLEEHDSTSAIITR